MRISKFRIKNYVSYHAQDENIEWIELDRGINIVLGANNSGKTALLDALSRAKSRSPHRSESTIPTPDSEDTPSIDIDFEYEFPDNDLLDILRNHGRQSFVQVCDTDSSCITRRIRSLQTKLSQETHLRFSASPYEIQIGDHRESLEVLKTMELPYYPFAPNKNERFNFEADQVKERLSPGEETWCQTIQSYVFRNVFKFQAERHIPAHADVALTRDLKSDASNLPQVLYTIEQCDCPTFSEFKQLVRCVFPNISEITTRKISQIYDEDDYLEIYVGYNGVSVERQDLMIPLVGCGSGLAQVMAILLGIVSSKEDRVFLIDEPSTFLHPQATRDLLKLIESFPRHQYIIATHSPTAIMSVGEKRLLLVKRENMVSIVKGVDVSDHTQLEEVLREIGSSRSDVFGMDKYIWVEGPTELACFNLIMDANEGLPDDVQIQDLVNVDDLKRKRDAALVEQIYERLSDGVGILPSALAFIFDGDKRPDNYGEADNSKGRTKYLERWNFESYFLDFEGFADIVSDLLNAAASSEYAENYSTDAVQSWIDRNRSNEEYFKGRDKSVETWIQNIDGAKLLAGLFSELSEHTLEYDKPTHGKQITERILAQNPDHFHEIVDLIKGILEKERQPASA